MSNASARARESPTKWVRRRGILSRCALDDLVVLAADDKVRPLPLVISGSAAVVWELLAEPTSVEEMAIELASFYDENAASVAADLGPALASLEIAGVVERAW